MSIGVPIKVLHEAEGHTVTVETMLGEVYRGKLLEAEDNMNVQAVNFFVKTWGNTTKATVRHAWSALLPQLKSAETKRQQPAELMNQVLETVRSIPAPGFQEVTREDLEEMMQEGNTNDVEDLLEDEEGDESGDAGETEKRKVTTQKLSLLLGVFTSLQEMIQDIESESGEREHVIGVTESISRKYQTQYNERVNARQQSLITRFLSQRRPTEEDQQREIEVEEDIDDIGEMPEDFDFAGFDEMEACTVTYRNGQTARLENNAPMFKNMTGRKGGAAGSGKSAILRAQAARGRGRGGRGGRGWGPGGPMRR
ncbi:Small nuclear ribonucleoprotein Sm D3-like [Homarus americanus]|uniref:Small nuclear ribonucleoprotein Sm D3-like n=1 Tax=Homarus americanus TaxID=6706 RepID=A0A8J5N9W0_HOMAM|nr:Small nuclear ribonucleoprotein Sm D3-like [Homarus americanus]